MAGRRASAGRSSVTIYGSDLPGEGYDFYVERQITPAQRLVRISATPDVYIDKNIDPRDAGSLIVHERRVGAVEELRSAPLPPVWLPGIDEAEPAFTSAPTDREISILQRPRGVSLTVDDSTVHIDAVDEGARFAFDLAPGWSGADGLERQVRIVATPGVRTGEERAGDALSSDTFGRRLVPDVIRVQDPALVPEQGTRIDPGVHVRRRVVTGVNHRDPRTALAVIDGRAGTVVHEPETGVRLSIQPADPSIGAHYAYQIVAPRDKREFRGRAEIRVLVGPHARIEVLEPRARPPLGADEIDTFADSNVELVLYETDDPETIPPPGEPLEPAYLAAVGRRREVDRRVFVPLTRGQALAVGAADMAMSAAPGAGEVYDLAQLGHAALTGVDLQGREVSRLELAILGVAVLLPFAGGGALRTAAKGTRTAEAAGFGLDVRDLAVLVDRVAFLTPADRAVVARVERAIRAGEPVDPDDLRHMSDSLQSLGFVADLPPDALRTLHLADQSAGLGHARASFAEQVIDTPRMGEAVESLGAGPEREAMKSTHARGAGAVTEAGEALVHQHHVLPQQHRAWFEERGFVGEHDIDNYCVELNVTEHQVVHGGGSFKLARQAWPEHEWNTALMQRLRDEEQRRVRTLGRNLNRDEILAVARRLMVERDLADRPFVRYKNRKRKGRRPRR